MQGTCPNCGGELLRRPRRKTRAVPAEDRDLPTPGSNKTWLIWAVSFAVWTFVALAATVTIFEFYSSMGSTQRFMSTLALEFSQILPYAPLTPFVFAFSIRYPFQRENWGRRSLLYLALGLVFSIAHITMRALTPYGFWDSHSHTWVSAIWDPRVHTFKVQWRVFESLFFSNVVDDITGTFVPIVLIAHATSYYRRFRERELRATQLEGQLAKAHLQALKSQLQPHFLFNTMHSISALMLTDVQAADRMMTRLSDLLRMTLDDAGTQITTLSRELEFVSCYLEIEKVRFEERLTVVLDIAPDTLDAQVPHLLLQPLVDNAVKHGISRLPAGGEIRITSCACGGELRLEINDNGLGFGSPSTLQTRGLGLRTTRERLETLYGDEQSLELQSPTEGGAAVCVRIPFRVELADANESVPDNDQ
jgi:two-component system LytT family sensor kinase